MSLQTEPHEHVFNNGYSPAQVARLMNDAALARSYREALEKIATCDPEDMTKLDNAPGYASTTQVIARIALGLPH